MSRVQLTVDIGEVDVFDLKIVGIDGVIGTLHVEKKGLGFSPPRAKKRPKSRADWRQLPLLVAFMNGKGS